MQDIEEEFSENLTAILLHSFDDDITIIINLTFEGIQNFLSDIVVVGDIEPVHLRHSHEQNISAVVSYIVQKYNDIPVEAIAGLTTKIFQIASDGEDSTRSVECTPESGILIQDKIGVEYNNRIEGRSPN